MGRRVDAYATERQYLDHLVPIWWALRPEERGRFYLAGSLADQADTHGIGADAWIGHCPSGDRVTMVASYRDEVNCPRPVVYVEHGAAQRYSTPDGVPLADPAYHGSAGHGRVVLFICPREEVCAAWRERYPFTPAVAVGCPKLDYRLRVGPRIRNPESRRTVCVSFHSDLRVCAETTSALRHYEPGLAAVVAEVRAAGCDFIGHGHPRDWQRIRAVWDRLGVETVSDFHEVLGRADVFAVDTSSTLYEAAACGIRVVAMNAPWYRRDVHHGLRWWDKIPGPQVDGPGELAAVLLAEETPDEAEHRRGVVGHVYAYLDGHSADRAAEAIRAIAD